MPRPRAANFSPYIKEKVLAEYAVSNSVSYVANKMKLTPKQVSRIIDLNRDDYNEYREQAKKEMVLEIWGNLIDAQKLAAKQVKEALDGKRDIPLNHISNLFGTMFDKQQLLSGENTQNVGGDGIQIVFSMPDVAEDESKWKEE